jgi:predicted MFS family arabinose efflux permease
MVFTHIPSNILLILVPLMPTFALAIAVLLMRFAISQMDVPTRQSYVAAVVRPSERTVVSSFTNLARNVFWAIGSAVAGFSMQNFSFSAPLLLGGSAKICDVLLFSPFERSAPRRNSNLQSERQSTSRHLGDHA